MIKAHIVTGPLKAALVEQAKVTDRATQWAIREVGRDVKRVARKRAPVYGVTARTTLHGPAKPRADVIPGLLRDSIYPSKRLKKEGRETWSLKIGPRGQRVHLYAGKIEAQAHYMADGYAYAIARAPMTFERGWNRSMARARR